MTVALGADKTWSATFAREIIRGEWAANVGLPLLATVLIAYVAVHCVRSQLRQDRDLVIRGRALDAIVAYGFALQGCASLISRWHEMPPDVFLDCVERKVEAALSTGSRAQVAAQHLDFPDFRRFGRALADMLKAVRVARSYVAVPHGGVVASVLHDVFGYVPSWLETGGIALAHWDGFYSGEYTLGGIGDLPTAEMDQAVKRALDSWILNSNAPTESA